VQSACFSMLPLEENFLRRFGNRKTVMVIVVVGIESALMRYVFLCAMSLTLWLYITFIVVSYEIFIAHRGL